MASDQSKTTPPGLTAHALARLLLSFPDLPVVAQRGSVEEPVWEARVIWAMFGWGDRTDDEYRTGHVVKIDPWPTQLDASGNAAVFRIRASAATAAGDHTEAARLSELAAKWEAFAT